ncbi:helix-turn-helix domain-containing protein [Lacticaseibacillus suibinensis]|uniref:helix-turn-helix domain-containing protein n=1 Tax=Lacticaseibacillus suibinensis TaxID=2486011 RepID=UPI001CDB4A82|nr:S24 family peptidase [Lacticaseibacillus suibinensis]
MANRWPIERIRAVLKQRRINAGLSAEELAKRIGVSKTTIYRYESGEIEKMPVNVLNKLANELNINPFFVLGIDDDDSRAAFDAVNLKNEIQRTLSSKEANHISTVRKLHPERQQKVYTYAEKQLNEQQNEHVVPFTEQREIVCGRGTAAGAPIDGDAQDAEVRRTRVNVDDIPASADEIVTVEGDSMEPDYPKYSQIFVRWQDTIDDGDLAVVRVADEGVTFKQVSRDYQQKKIVLHSLNDKYPDRYLDPEDISIIGVVLN